MKKLSMAGLLLTCFLLMAACGDPNDLLIDFTGVSEITVIHTVGGQDETINLVDNEVEAIHKWIGGLSLITQDFSEQNSPGWNDGNELYHFILDNGAEFVYVKSGTDACYILTDEWYLVENPSVPPY